MDAVEGKNKPEVKNALRQARWGLPLMLRVLLALGVCPSGLKGQAGEPAAEVRARETAFSQTMADRDLDAFLTLISPEAIFFNGNEPLRGLDAIARA